MEITAVELLGLAAYLSIPVLGLTTGTLVLVLFRWWDAAKALPGWLRLLAIAASQVLALVGSPVVWLGWLPRLGDVMIAEFIFGPLVVTEAVMVPALLAFARASARNRSRTGDELPA